MKWRYIKPKHLYAQKEVSTATVYSWRVSCLKWLLTEYGLISEQVELVVLLKKGQTNKQESGESDPFFYET